MVKSRRILSTVLAIVMVLTMIPMYTFSTVGAVVAEDAAINTAASVDTGDGKLVTPVVTLQATPVFRVASSSSVFVGGNTLVNATDSGLPEISGTYSNAFYAGETPHGYTVTFTSDKALSGTPSLGCDVTGIGITDALKSGNTYSWTITAGSASLTAGQNIHFTVDYTYSYKDILSGKTVEKSYKATTSSHVENVTNGAGTLLERTRKKTHLHENEHMGFLFRILGANTYNTFSGGSTSYDVGYINFVSHSWVNDGSVTGLQYKNAEKDNSDGNEYYSSGTDVRSLATTYVDRNGTDGASLSVNNLRFSFHEYQNRTKDTEYERYVRGLFTLEGICSYNLDTKGSNTAKTQIGLEEFEDSRTIAGYGEMHFPMTGNTYNDAADEADNGNLVSSYTIVGNAGTYYPTTKRVCNSKIGVSMTINSYDKSELRAMVNELVSSEQNEPTTPALNSGIGINPQSGWYSAGYDAYKTALTNAQNIIATPDTDQNTIDAACTDLDTAVKGLVVANADTEALELALEAYLGKNPSAYLPASWNAAKAKYEAAVATKEYSVFYQSAVDKATDDLNAALAELEASGYALADWDAAEELYEEYDELLESKELFTPESWKVLEDAVAYAKQEQAKGTYYVPDQGTVNEIIAAIGKAIDDLDDALADYTEYDAQVARYNDVVIPNKLKIEKSLADAGVDLAALGITNIYTENSWKAVQAWLKLERDYTYKEQEDVDDAAYYLEEAIDNLTLVNASYTSLNATKKAAEDLEESWYTAESYAKLTKALNAVKTGYKIDKQPEVNQMEADIKTAVSGLVEAGANYTSYETYAGYAKDLDSKIYTEQSYKNFISALDNVTLTYKAKDQATLDAEMNLVIVAYNNLEKLPADYSAVDAAKARWTNFPNKTNYTDVSVLAVTNAIGAVVTGKKIDEQEAVNTMAKNINDAIDNLALKPADYTALEVAFADAKAAIKTQSDFATARDGYSYYTTASYSTFMGIYETIPVNQDGTLKKDKKITEQATVTGWATSLAGAVSGLTPNKADYSALAAALLTVPSEDDLENIYTTETAAAVAVAAFNGQNAIDADEYTVEQQDAVDELTSILTDAVGNLKEKPLDLTTYTTAVGRIPADLSIYTTESVNAMNAAKAAADAFKTNNNKISKQEDFEKLVSAFDQSITDLVENITEKFEFVGTAKTATKNGVKYVYGLKAQLTKTNFGKYIENENTTYTVKSVGMYVGTGSTVTVFNSKGQQIDQYVVVIYGDVDGNGKINANDYHMAVDAAIGASSGTPLSGANQIAANVDGTLVKINKQDYDKIAEAADGKAELDQAKAIR